MNDIDYSESNIRRNSIMTTIIKICSMGLSFFSSPLMLQCLGTEKYGIWASTLSLVSWIYYFDIGIGGGLQNKLATALAQGRDNDARKLVGAAYLILSILSLIGFIVGVLFFTFFDVTKFLNFKTVDENISLILVISLFFTCIVFVTQLITNILFAIQKASIVSFFGLVGQTLFFLLLICFNRFSVQSLFWVVVANGIVNVLKNIFASIFVVIRFPRLRGSFKDVSVKNGKSIISFGMLIFIINIGALILNSTDNLLISHFYGPAEVTPYSFCNTYFSMIQSVFVAVVLPSLGAFTAAYAQNNYQRIKKLVGTNLIFWLIFSIGTIIAGFIFIPFTKFWLRKELFFPKGLIPLMVFYYVLLMLGHITGSFINAIYGTKRIIIPSIISTLINIPMSIIFSVVLGLGLSGIILGTCVSAIFMLPFQLYVFVDSLKKMKINHLDEEKK